MTNKFITLKPDEFPKKAPSESTEQITFFNQLRKHYPEIAKGAFHVKNEGKKTYATAMKDKAEGLLSGVVDIIIMGETMLYIEMKKVSKRAKATSSQVEFLNLASDLGHDAYLCYGWEMAWVALETWIQRRKQ